MRFRGGVHPAYHKLTAGAPVAAMPLRERYVVPLAQHLGAPAEPLVGKGDLVARGQALGKAVGFVSAPVHAPTSGKVTAVKEFPHPLGRPLPAVEIAADGEDRWHEEVRPHGDWRELPPADLVQILWDAGLVGMGGATFPTHVKLSPPADRPIDTFVLNGAECEPYLTADHRVMVEHPRQVMEGVGLMMRALGVGRAFVGVEANKRDALQALRRECPPDVRAEFVLLDVKYPQGSEKHLAYALTRRVVPAGGLPMDVGCLVQNVGTALASFEAVHSGTPLIERVVTVTGEAVRRPANLLVRVGTLLADVLAHCGGLTEDVAKVIFGGPMMGFGQFSLEVPLLKGTSGVLCLPAREVAQYAADPCLRCGQCVDACPMGLVPGRIAALVENRRFADLADWHVADCIECGSCAYVCPSYRPLVQYCRRGKAELRVLQRREKERRERQEREREGQRQAQEQEQETRA